MKRTITLFMILVSQLGFARQHKIRNKYDETISIVEQPFRASGIFVNSNKLIVGIDINGRGYLEINYDDTIIDFKIQGGDTYYTLPSSYRTSPDFIYYKEYKRDVVERIFFTLSDHDKNLLMNSNEIVILATRSETFGAYAYLDKVKLKKD